MNGINEWSRVLKCEFYSRPTIPSIHSIYPIFPFLLIFFVEITYRFTSPTFLGLLTTSKAHTIISRSCFFSPTTQQPSSGNNYDITHQRTNERFSLMIIVVYTCLLLLAIAQKNWMLKWKWNYKSHEERIRNMKKTQNCCNATRFNEL